MDLKFKHVMNDTKRALLPDAWARSTLLLICPINRAVYSRTFLLIWVSKITREQLYQYFHKEAPPQILSGRGLRYESYGHFSSGLYGRRSMVHSHQCLDVYTVIMFTLDVDFAVY